MALQAQASNQTLHTAVQQGSVGISFGGAGFLIFYYIGIVEVLSKLGVIKHDAKLAGASSGALIATSQCSGLSPPDIFNAGHALAKACRAERSCSGSLDRELRKTLQDHLPGDAWQRCRNTGYISISAGSPLGPSQPLLVSDFKSQDDLISAAAVSSFIPLWSSSSFTTMFRGLQAFDGGYTQQQPCPPDVQYCIRVSSRNPSWPAARGIGSFLSILGRLGDVLDDNNNNNNNAGTITEQAKAYPSITSTGPDGDADPSLLQLAATNNVDIAPGVFNHVPFSQSEWNSWALSPADDQTLQVMHQLGKKDAEMWAQHMGIKAVQSGSASGAGRGKATGKQAAGAAAAGQKMAQKVQRDHKSDTADKGGRRLKWNA